VITETKLRVPVPDEQL